LDVSSATSGTPEATQARHIIRQAQLGAMLRHIEAVARVGFTCELPGLGVVTCKPFVTSLLVDTKERWQFCCLRGERCCAWCRIRKGRSLFRVSTPHCLAQVQREWALADSTTVSAAVRAGARSRLQRWGFHATRRSCFIEVCRESRLGPGPDDGGEVFGGTAGVDVMHGLYIKMTRELFAVLRLLCKTGKHAVALDEAIKTLRFRDPTSGTRSRGVEGISSDLGITAERRVHLLFALGAVLGTTGSILRHTQAVKTDFLQAVCSAQIVFLSTRRHRAFTYGSASWCRAMTRASDLPRPAPNATRHNRPRPCVVCAAEMQAIYTGEGLKFYGAMEQLHEYLQRTVHGLGIDLLGVCAAPTRSLHAPTCYMPRPAPTYTMPQHPCPLPRGACPNMRHAPTCPNIPNAPTPFPCPNIPHAPTPTPCPNTHAPCPNTLTHAPTPMPHAPTSPTPSSDHTFARFL